MTIGSAGTSYEILSKLAEGGMAELFLARSSSPGAGAPRYVVLKRIAKSRATDTQYVRMFLDEARLASQLRHPNIAQVFEIGRLGASYFFTMEYVHGVTVAQLLQAASDRGIVMPIGAVLAIVAGTAAGLDHAHERRGIDGSPLGIVHRDISPSNLIVSYEGHLKVVDFGVAKAMGRPETQAGEIKGKVGYLSPEQCRMQKIDRRSDLYSLGVVAWEMLTLERLWLRDTAFGTLAAIATEVPEMPSRLRPDLPPEIDAFTRKLLTLDPADRFQTAQAVVDAAEQVANRTRTSATSQQLARLLRDLFGAPAEPWHALEEQIVNVIATPVPAEESLETFDDYGPAVSDVEAKLTTVFRAVTEDVSATNVFAVRASGSEETREVPALARATSVGEAPPLTPPPMIAPRIHEEHQTMRDPHLEMSTERALPEPGHTMIGAGEPPMRLPSAPAYAPAYAPAPGSGGRQAPIPEAAPVAANVAPTVQLDIGAVAGSGPQRPSIPGSSGPYDRASATPLSGPQPRGSGAIPPSGPHGRSSGAIAPSGPLPANIAPTAMLELPAQIVGSGPRPSVPQAALPTRGAMMALPRYPPPPHGARSKLPWWILGGSVLGVVGVLVVLALRSESSSSPRFTADERPDAPIVIVASSPDAAAAGDAAAAAAIDAAPAIVDAEVADAAVAPDAPEPDDLDELEHSKPMPPRPRMKLRTKPELNLAFRERRYKEIVAACVELGPEDERAVVCTLAACRARDKRAQDWYRNVAPKQRDGTIRICKNAGHKITDVCTIDVLACRK